MELGDLLLYLEESFAFPYPEPDQSRQCPPNRYAKYRWSRGSVLAFGTQVRWFKPDRSSWIFQGEKILSMPSFRGEVKPSVQCRRFTALKGSRVFSGRIHRPFLAHVVPPLTARISRRRLVAKVGTFEK